MAAGERIFMAKESTSQEILENTRKIIKGNVHAWNQYYEANSVCSQWDMLV